MYTPDTNILTIILTQITSFNNRNQIETTKNLLESGEEVSKRYRLYRMIQIVGKSLFIHISSEYF